MIKMNLASKAVILLASAVFLIAIGACISIPASNINDTLELRQAGNILVDKARRADDSRSQYKLGVALIERFDKNSFRTINIENTETRFRIDAYEDEILKRNAKWSHAQTIDSYENRWVLLQKGLTWLYKARASHTTDVNAFLHPSLFKHLCGQGNRFSNDTQLQYIREKINTALEDKITVTDEDCLESALFLKQQLFNQKCTQDTYGIKDLFNYFERKRMYEEAGDLFIFMVSNICQHDIDKNFRVISDEYLEINVENHVHRKPLNSEDRIRVYAYYLLLEKIYLKEALTDYGKGSFKRNLIDLKQSPQKHQRKHSTIFKPCNAILQT